MQKNRYLITNRTTEMIRWLANNPKIQRRICCEGYDIEPDECLEIIEMLEQEGFYELVYILLMKNVNHVVIANAVEKLQYKAWSNEWEKIGNEKMCMNIKEQIKNGMLLREIKNNDMF